MRERDTMPEPLRRAVRHLIMEALHSLQEVMAHTQPDSRDWRRMPLYRVTDAIDTLSLLAAAQAACVAESGTPEREVEGFLQLEQQIPRAVHTQEGQEYLDALLGRPAKDPATATLTTLINNRNDPTAPDEYGDTEAVLYALQYARSEEPAAFDRLPPAIADRARRIAAILAEEPALAAVPA
ncbi:hypothetical protein [Kitasatospora sp. NPDC050543]|uniref:hypothetical protein n=1 Tax=Kitasatospora sp. NPDC050543 TaxID=3364054 RepID=UPI0037B16F2A